MRVYNIVFTRHICTDFASFMQLSKDSPFPDLKVCSVNQTL